MLGRAMRFRLVKTSAKPQDADCNAKAALQAKAKKIIQRPEKQRDADGDEDVVEAGDQPQPFFIRIACRVAVLDQEFREVVGSAAIKHALGDSGLKLGAAKGEIAGVGHHRLSTVTLPLV